MEIFSSWISRLTYTIVYVHPTFIPFRVAAAKRVPCGDLADSFTSDALPIRVWHWAVEALAARWLGIFEVLSGNQAWSLAG